jgi:hypothetical protein
MLEPRGSEEIRCILDDAISDRANGLLLLARRKVTLEFTYNSAISRQTTALNGIPVIIILNHRVSSLTPAEITVCKPSPRKSQGPLSQLRRSLVRLTVTEVDR